MEAYFERSFTTLGMSSAGVALLQTCKTLRKPLQSRAVSWTVSCMH